MGPTRVSIRPLAALLVAGTLVVGCGGGDSPTSITVGEVPNDTATGPAPDDPGIGSEEKADPGCDGAGVAPGDPAFEEAFCAYSAAAIAATSGPGGVDGVDPAALGAGQRALALVDDDPGAAIAILRDATTVLAG